MDVFIWEVGVSWKTERRGCLGSDVFSVKTELNSRLFPLASWPLCLLLLMFFKNIYLIELSKQC